MSCEEIYQRGVSATVTDDNQWGRTGSGSKISGPLARSLRF